MTESGFRNTVSIEDPESNNDLAVNADGSINIGRTEVVATIFNSTIAVNTDVDINTVGIDRLAIQAFITQVTAFELYIELQASNDGLTFVTIPVSVVHLTSSDDVMWNVPSIGYKFLNIHTNMVSGSVTLKLIVNNRAFN
jgi:hypothetical protein